MTNGTEDDTFNVLRRPGFDEMLRLHNEWRIRTGFGDTSKRIPFMQKHNWTWLEFAIEANKRGKEDSII
jgi:hypothetical protein